MPERFEFGNIEIDEPEERDQRSEALVRFLRSAEEIEALHGKSLREALSGEREKRALIESLDPRTFSELLDGMNGILRKKKKDEWGMDGETVALESIISGIGYVPPRQEDKPGLLEKTLETAKEMNREGRSLEDIALLVSSSLNAIHPYLDANGRTSRLIYTLLTQGVDEARLREVLGVYGRDKIDADPGLIQTDIEDLLIKEIGTKDPERNTDGILAFYGRFADMRFGPEVPEEDAELLTELAKKDRWFMFLSVYRYLEQREDRGAYLREFPERTVVPLDILSTNLGPDGVRAIMRNYRELKKRYVSTLIDAIAHPEKEEYEIEREGERISLKSFFELRMKEEAEKIAEEDKRQKELQEAVERNRKMIEEKEADIKRRFVEGEGDRAPLSPETIDSLRRLDQEIAQIIGAETSEAAEETSEEQKLKILSDSLFELAQKINSHVSISREQIDAYVQDRKAEIIEAFSHYRAASKLASHIDASGGFKYRFGTSKDYEVPFFEQKNLSDRERAGRFLDDLFSQSLYYASEAGPSLRIKMFEARSKNAAEMVQQTMERIFYSDKMVDYVDKKVVRVNGTEPSPQKYVFEISSPGFQDVLRSREAAERPLRTDIATIADEGAIYVNVPNGSILHSGWHIVSVKELR